ncbi:MAG: peptidyl-prolyl cis-trans isomerase [Nitrospiraceae bacterium]|nr:peptidyl-prolyl cis-trans isomerase [Nitrospiraceae bacterium]
MRYVVSLHSALCCALGLCIALAGCALRKPATPEAIAEAGAARQVVARVNGVELFADEQKSIRDRMIAANLRKGSAEPPEETAKKALDLLIFQELAVQEAQRQGLTLGEGGLDKAIANLRTRQGGEDGFQAFLAREQITEAELRRRVERGLLIQLLLNREVLTKASVTDDEARSAYEREKENYIAPEKITVDDMVFFLDQESPASMSTAQKILADIRAAKDQDPAALTGRGPFIVHEVEISRAKEPELYDAARTLKDGELSGVIKTPDSIHIIKLKEYLAPRPQPFEEVKAAIEKKLKTAAQLKLRQDYEQELRKGATIELSERP